MSLGTAVCISVAPPPSVPVVRLPVWQPVRPEAPPAGAPHGADAGHPGHGPVPDLRGRGKGIANP